MDASTLRHFLVDKWMFRDQQFVNRISVVRRVRDGLFYLFYYIS